MEWVNCWRSSLLNKCQSFRKQNDPPFKRKILHFWRFLHMISQHRSIFYIPVYCYASTSPLGVSRVAGGFESFRRHRSMVIFSESGCAHPEYVVCISEERTPPLKIKNIINNTVFFYFGVSFRCVILNIWQLTSFSRFSTSISFIFMSSNGDFAGRSLSKKNKKSERDLKRYSLY